RDRIDPDRARAHSELRERLGLDPGGPALYLLTESGKVDPDLPAFRRGATVITTRQGAARLAGGLAGPSRAVEAGSDTITASGAMAVVRGDGHRVVLTEGGPTIIGEFLRGEMLDEVFVAAAAAAVVVTGAFAPVAVATTSHPSTAAPVRQQQIDFWRTHGYLVPNVRSYLAQKAAADRRAGIPTSPSTGRTRRAPTIGAS